MTTATAQPPTTTADPTPAWFQLLLVWRVITAMGIAAALVGVLVQRGIVVDGPIRWTLLVALLGLLTLAGVAVRGTLRHVHRGRFAGFWVDFLIAIVFGFVALNRMEMFTGLDAVGEQFNSSAGWILIIALGWLISGFAERAGPSQKAIKQVARWTAGAGAVILLLTMNIVPGLIEFAKRLVGSDVVVVALVALVAAAFARILWSDSAARFFGTTRQQGESMDGMLFVAPNMLGFITFFAGPLIISFFISFTDWDGLTDATFVGFQNYIDLFSDTLFLKSLRNIVVFGAVAIPLAVLPALLLAALLNSKLPGMKGFRAIYFLPSIAGVVGVTLIWAELFNSTVGYLNFTILKITEWANALMGTGIEAPQPQWISDANIALFSVVILFVWQTIGFNTVLFLAGMQGINPTLYEAAEIDGAGAWKKFSKITVPLLKSTTVFVVATTTILALQLFNEPFILQSPASAAGPGNSTLSPVVYLYQNAFQEFQIGYASAVAWALFVLIFGITLLYFRRSGDEGVFST